MVDQDAKREEHIVAVVVPVHNSPSHRAAAGRRGNLSVVSQFGRQGLRAVAELRCVEALWVHTVTV